MKIRKMRASDIEIIYNIGKMVGEFGQTRSSRFWSKNQLSRWINNKNDVLLVAEENNKIIGFVMTQLHIPTKKAIIENAYVEKGYRRKRIGTKLIKESLKTLTAKGATYKCGMISLKNATGLKFVKSLNFQKWNNFAWFEK